MSNGKLNLNRGLITKTAERNQAIRVLPQNKPHIYIKNAETALEIIKKRLTKKNL